MNRYFAIAMLLLVVTTVSQAQTFNKTKMIDGKGKEVPVSLAFDKTRLTVRTLKTPVADIPFASIRKLSDEIASRNRGKEGAIVMIASPAVQSPSATAPSQFEDAQYFLKVANEKNAKPVDGVFSLDGGTKVVRFVSKGKTEVEIPYGNITNLLFERTATPRYAAAVLLSPLFLFTKSKKHFLTIQYKDATGTGQYALIRFDKKNWQSALAAVEAQTGVKVERVREK